MAGKCGRMRNGQKKLRVSCPVQKAPEDRRLTLPLPPVWMRSARARRVRLVDDGARAELPCRSPKLRASGCGAFGSRRYPDRIEPITPGRLRACVINPGEPCGIAWARRGRLPVTTSVFLERGGDRRPGCSTQASPSGRLEMRVCSPPAQRVRQERQAGAGADWKSRARIRRHHPDDTVKMGVARLTCRRSAAGRSPVPAALTAKLNLFVCTGR